MAGRLTDQCGQAIDQVWKNGVCVTPPAEKRRWWECGFCGRAMIPQILKWPRELEPAKYVFCHGCTHCGAHGPIGRDWEDAAQRTAGQIDQQPWDRRIPAGDVVAR